MKTRLALLLWPLLLAACTPEPDPIRYGHDACAHCRMIVSDARYGAELVTRTGKTYPFDSIECLATYLHEHPDRAGQAHSLWVTAFDRPGHLIEHTEAFYLHSPNLRSPMGANLTAFSPAMTPEAALNAFSGTVVPWDDVRRIARGDTAHGPFEHPSH